MNVDEMLWLASIGVLFVAGLVNLILIVFNPKGEEPIKFRLTLLYILITAVGVSIIAKEGIDEKRFKKIMELQGVSIEAE